MANLAVTDLNPNFELRLQQLDSEAKLNARDGGGFQE